MNLQSSFACAINCMDGRIQDAVKNYMKERYGVDHVDMVTEPGPNKILAANTSAEVIENIKKRVAVSVQHHGATAVALPEILLKKKNNSNIYKKQKKWLKPLDLM